MPVSRPLTVVLPHTRPGSQELRAAPAPSGAGSPGPPHGRRTAPASGAGGDDRAATLEQAPPAQRPQEVEQAQIGPKRHVSNDTRQNVIETVE